MRVLIVYNPTAGSANQAFLESVRDVMQAQDVLVDLYPTKAAGDGLDYLSNYQDTLDMVVAAGGDGTVNEVVNGMRAHANQTWRLGIIPLGTTNVLARELGIKKSVRFVADMLLQAREKPIYPARLNGRRFMLMAGIGFDAWVVDNVDLALKKRAGKLAYGLSIIKQLRHFGKKEYHVIIDGTDYLARSAIITNGRLYGGSFIISRQADLSSPYTQVLMLQGKHPLTLFWSLVGLPLGLMEKMPRIVSVAARDIQIEVLNSEDECEPVQADGDSFGHLPVRIQMEDQPLRVIVP